jgi:hypothetical protein
MEWHLDQHEEENSNQIRYSDIVMLLDGIVEAAEDQVKRHQQTHYSRLHPVA